LDSAIVNHPELLAISRSAVPVDPGREKTVGESIDQWLTSGGSPDAVGQALGRALSDLHRIPVGECPFIHSTKEVLAELAVMASTVGPDRKMPDPYDRYNAAQLVELATRQLDLVADGDPVVLHGNLTAAAVRIPVAAAGVADVGVKSGGAVPSVELGHLDQLGVGDRHLDLAAVHRFLPEVAGAEALFAFYDAYGTDPNLVALDGFILLGTLRDELGSTGFPSSV